MPEWRLVQAHGRSYCEGLLEHARTNDLVVVSQRHSDWDYADMFNVPEEVAIDAGRPVLIVPATGDLPIIGQRINVAWNGKREGARAVFDALPLLRQAHDVRVLWINPQNEAIGRGDIATAEICATLSVTVCAARARKRPPIALKWGRNSWSKWQRTTPTCSSWGARVMRGCENLSSAAQRDMSFIT